MLLQGVRFGHRAWWKGYTPRRRVVTERPTPPCALLAIPTFTVARWGLARVGLPEGRFTYRSRLLAVTPMPVRGEEIRVCYWWDPRRCASIGVNDYGGVVMLGGINPYSFVPLPESVPRGEPTGHDSLGTDCYSGGFDVTFTTVTPLYLRDARDLNRPDPERDRRDVSRAVGPDGAVGPVMIPGSSLKGAVRSLHEAVTASCMRVVDTHFVPTHRTPVLSGLTAGWRMAVIQELDNLDEKKLPTAVTLCEGRHLSVRATGVGARLPIRADGRPWRTGDRFNLNGSPSRSEHGNRWLPPEGGIVASPTGAYVLLITDTKARPDHVRINRQNHPCQVYFAAGKVTNDVRRLSAEARKTLSRNLDGAEDHQPRTASVSHFAEVYWPLDGERNVGPLSKVIGERRRADGTFDVGQPIWVKVTGGPQGEVTQVRLAQAWRDYGMVETSERAGELGERLGQAEPCRDPSSLCPSCQVFGSAGDDEAETEGPNAQRSYQGHVRFTDALAVGEPKIWDDFNRAPLSVPKPSAGQFYLDNTGWEGDANEERPLAHWGSEADRGASPRNVRGRKFYWATTSQNPGKPAEQHRSNRAPHHNSSQCEMIQLIAPGAEFITRVTFDNLTAAQIGGVLACFDPRRLQPEGEEKPYVLRLGGGKPFGWGACTGEITGFTAANAQQRYLKGKEGDLTEAACIRAFLEQVSLSQELRNLLTLDFVPDAAVHYPAPQQNPLGEPDFDFWSVTSGVKLRKGGPRPLKSLPSAAQPADSQPMWVVKPQGDH